MTDNDLILLAQKLVKENWGDTLDISISFTGRYKRLAGALYTKNKKPIEIKICKGLIKDKERLKDVVLHELTHYVLCKRGLPYKDGCKTFESELYRVGSTSSGVFVEDTKAHQESIMKGTKTPRKQRMLLYTYKNNSSESNYLDVYYKGTYIGKIWKYKASHWVHMYDGYPNKEKRGYKTRYDASEHIRKAMSIEA